MCRKVTDICEVICNMFLLPVASGCNSRSSEEQCYKAYFSSENVLSVGACCCDFARFGMVPLYSIRYAGVPSNTAKFHRSSAFGFVSLEKTKKKLFKWLLSTGNDSGLFMRGLLQTSAGTITMVVQLNTVKFRNRG